MASSHVHMPEELGSSFLRREANSSQLSPYLATKGRVTLFQQYGEVLRGL